MIDGQPRSASVTTLKDCQVLFLPTHAFARAIEEHPSIAKSVTNALCDIILSLPKLKINSSKGLGLIQNKNVRPDLENMRRLTAIIREYNRLQSQRA